MKKHILIIGTIASALLTGGCTIVPGMHVERFKDHSSNELPITDESGDESIRHVGITPITAKLIIEQSKNADAVLNQVEQDYYENRAGSKREDAPNTPYYQYRVGATDILTITVWDHPELTIPAGQFRSAESSGTVVGEDGTIYYPYVGVLQAAGKTVEVLRADLTKKLSRYIENVQLDVRVAGYRSQRTYVVGEVRTPGIFRITDIPLTIVEAINRAEGFSPEADRRNITLTREGKTYRVDLLALYEKGAASQNILLRHGDVVNIPDRSLNKVFVLGEVREPQSLVMNKGRMTLNEILLEAGGLNQDTADAAQVFVFRGGVGKPEMFHLNAKAPDALLLADRFALQPRDVVYVDAAEGVRWNRVIAQIQPTVSLLNSIVGLDVPLLNGTSPGGSSQVSIVPSQ